MITMMELQYLWIQASANSSTTHSSLRGGTFWQILDIGEAKQRSKKSKMHVTTKTPETIKPKSKTDIINL